MYSLSKLCVGDLMPDETVLEGRTYWETFMLWILCPLSRPKDLKGFPKVFALFHSCTTGGHNVILFFFFFPPFFFWSSQHARKSLSDANTLFLVFWGTRILRKQILYFASHSMFGILCKQHKMYKVIHQTKEIEIYPPSAKAWVLIVQKDGRNSYVA